MAFARNMPKPGRFVDLSRFVDTPRQKKDPCFSCDLLFCDQTSPDCKFIRRTAFSPGSTLDRERKELIAELIDDGVIARVRPSGFIEYAGDTETAADRQRRSKREYMRRVRGKQCTTG